MPLYLLSSNQQKELLIRHQKLEVALPVPPDDPPDLVDWARSVLPEDFRPLVESARYDTIEVSPKVNASDENLTDVLGAIIGKDGPPAGILTIWVEAVIVRLSPRSPRGGPGPMKWPQNVVIGGRKLIDKERDAAAKQAAVDLQPGANLTGANPAAARPSGANPSGSRPTGSRP
jgi:hypothetical protein